MRVRARVRVSVRVRLTEFSPRDGAAEESLASQRLSLLREPMAKVGMRAYGDVERGIPREEDVSGHQALGRVRVKGEG